MSKAKALRALKRRRMQAQNGYSMHLLELWFADAETDVFRARTSGPYRQWLKRSVRRQEVRP